MPEKTRVQLLVSGRVQGVGYRWFVVDAADRLGLTGWVRNLDDGRVEVEAEGDKDEIDSLEEILRRGPQTARVTLVERNALGEAGRYTDFRVR